MTLIYKILPVADWDVAVAKGAFEGSPVDVQDGFIHFSDGRQAQETASKWFRDQTGLVLVAVEGDQLGEALKWEPSRGGALFPHLYGPLPAKLALWVRPLELDADGAPVVGELS